MPKRTYSTVRIMDGGTYNKTFVQFMLEKNDGEETIFTKYGTDPQFYPCSVMQQKEMILISKCSIGRFADLKMNLKEWVKMLTRMGSKQKVSLWTEPATIIN